jgi:cytochrome c biogenesis protein CcmG/thiol:disulfide interchange protein DsbE
MSSLRSLWSFANFAWKKTVSRKARRDPQSSQRKALGVAALLVLSVACNAIDTANKNTPVISNPPNNTTYPMPPFKGTSIANMGWEFSDGNRSVFADYQGKVLVLDFYATWCAPCRESIPHLIGLQKKYENQGLQVVGLNVGGPGDTEKVPAFAKEFGIQYPLGKPDEDLVSLLLSDNDGIPQTFVFDRQGQFVRRFVGYSEEAGERLDSAVESALQTPIR